MSAQPILPAGTYVVQIFLVGGAHAVSTWIGQKWKCSISPEDVGRALSRVADQWMPRKLRCLPAGAWLLVQVEYELGGGQQLCFPLQEQFVDAVTENTIDDLLRDRVVTLSVAAARELTKSIGVHEPLPAAGGEES
ncbi:MAG: hypothetical protein LCH95_13955 [Proteobacteria bacterium]|nr:hypothetical protein [Pseudomonadota bacterium]